MIDDTIRRRLGRPCYVISRAAQGRAISRSAINVALSATAPVELIGGKRLKWARKRRQDLKRAGLLEELCTTGDEVWYALTVAGADLASRGERA